jgi:hypothetical protein
MDQAAIIVCTALIFPLLIWLIVDFGVPAIKECRQVLEKNVSWGDRILVAMQVIAWGAASIAFLIAPVAIGRAAGLVGMFAGVVAWRKLVRDSVRVCPGSGS